jgi:hypothetical protein
MRKLTLTLALLLAGSATAFAQEMRMPVNADEVKWGPAPNVLPAGAQIAIISGGKYSHILGRWMRPIQGGSLRRSIKNARELQNRRSQSPSPLSDRACRTPL